LAVKSFLFRERVFAEQGSALADHFINLVIAIAIIFIHMASFGVGIQNGAFIVHIVVIRIFAGALRTSFA